MGMQQSGMRIGGGQQQQSIHGNAIDKSRPTGEGIKNKKKRWWTDRVYGHCLNMCARIRKDPSGERKDIDDAKERERDRRRMGS